MKKPTQVEQVIELLKQGYAQKTVAKRTGMWLASVGEIARAYNIGRRPGQTREMVARSYQSEVQARLLSRSPAQAIESFLNDE